MVQTLNLGQVITAMVTPFDQNLAVDLAGARRLARYLVDNGSDALVVAGTTGESPCLSDEEKLALFQAIKEEVGDRAKVIAGTGSNNTIGTVRLTSAAEALGVDAVMLVVPYYNKPSQEGLYQHFAQITDQTRVPVMLYNVPSRTGINMTAATVERLAQLERIIAIKEASGDLEQVARIRRDTPPEFAIYSGDDSLTLPMLALGCRGVVSVASHVAGTHIKDMIRAFFQGNHDQALAAHLQLFELFKVLFITSNPVPVKAAMQQLELCASNVRPPLVAASASEQAAIGQVLSNLGLTIAPCR